MTSVDRSGVNSGCVVTGGAGCGIGVALCNAIAARGFAVCVVDVDERGGHKVAEELRARDGKSLFVRADVSDSVDVERAVGAAVAEWGSIVGLVNSAGVGLTKRAAEVSEAEFDLVLGTNLRGAWLFARATIPAMLKVGGGSIVNIGSIHARAAQPGFAVYATAKGGLEALTRGLAADYGRDGVRCNIVHPGLVDSPLNRGIFSSWGVDPDDYMRAYRRENQLLDRSIHSRDIGELVAFLVSDAACAITGATFVIDAGTSVRLTGHERTRSIDERGHDDG